MPAYGPIGRINKSDPVFKRLVLIDDVHIRYKWVYKYKRYVHGRVGGRYKLSGSFSTSYYTFSPFYGKKCSQDKWLRVIMVR